MSDFTNSTITLNGQEIKTKTGLMKQSELNFFIENPRLYTIARQHGNQPTQDEIFDILKKRENVKELVQSIKKNGGLIDPIFVKEGENVVLEGNSRLAAYRILNNSDKPEMWSKIKVHLLPSNVTDDLVFALLGEYHIKGKTEWAPFEQAGFLHRRHTGQKISPKQLSDELKLPIRTINHLINVYKFMIDHSENEPTRWSYYDEYLKSTKVQKNIRAHYGAQIDELIVKKIKNGEIKKAVDVRDGLKTIAEGGAKVISKFVENKISFEDSISAAIEKGAGDSSVLKVNNFISWLNEIQNQKNILELNGDPLINTEKNLIKINKKIIAILEKIEKKKNNLSET